VARRRQQQVCRLRTKRHDCNFLRVLVVSVSA
jgi:hypothetical protein